MASTPRKVQLGGSNGSDESRGRGAIKMPLSATLGHPRVSSRGCVPHAEALDSFDIIKRLDVGNITFAGQVYQGAMTVQLADRRLGRTMSEEPTDIDAVSVGI